jgi:hypothetical protein
LEGVALLTRRVTGMEQGSTPVKQKLEQGPTHAQVRKRQPDMRQSEQLGFAMQTTPCKCASARACAKCQPLTQNPRIRGPA